MSMTSQQYAGLADKSYSNEHKVGVYPPGKRPLFEYEGVEYAVLEHASNPRNGYQGMIFQRVDTGEIIVAHRGTEEIIKDGALTDGSMMLSRVNPQVAEALTLTQRAIDRANDIGRETGYAPEVTLTGHSLGGTLAQITAHHFGLRGETFNAYGAASLGYRIDKGGDNILNHVMAGDTVSAASPHFGQVRVYANAGEIAALHSCGYANDRNPLDPRAPGVAIGALASSHRMHHFLNEDGAGKLDRSALSDPAARQLAEVFDPMIDKFRGDVAAGRGIATVAARGLHGNALDALGELRGPLPAGEPAVRAQRAAAAEAEVAQRLADYHAQRQQFFSERLPPKNPDAQPPDLLRRPGTKDTPVLHSPTPDYLQSKPSSRGGPGMEDSHGDRSAPSLDIRAQRVDQVQAFPTDHPRYSLYAALEERLPGVAKEKVAEITHQAVVGGITDVRQIRAVIVYDDQAWVAGRTPGDRANVSLSEPSPSLQESLRGIESSDRQQMQQTAQFQEQQKSASQGHSGPGHALT
ncbi:hypothetical protein [uncultured Pseudoxanthomonas sp.]|uniref:hypothetical protein n=1 Tax=uncultured Pseudoxanthomonas sp. TaxID=281701 RepID=UPI0026078022|nr:hypothetical protein [uncultured Pseudoxanthomonas sp.]